MLLKWKLMQFFLNFFALRFLCCESNLDLQNNIPRLGGSLMDLTSIFLLKMLEIVLEYEKLSKLCFIIRKTFRLLGSYAIVKGVIFSLLLVFGSLKISRVISLALNILAFISALGYFCSSNEIAIVLLNLETKVKI